jgi:hypothetical protein
MNSESLARETGPQFNPLRSSTSDGSLRVAMSGAVPALWCRAVGALDTLKIGWIGRSDRERRDACRSICETVEGARGA